MGWSLVNRWGIPIIGLHGLYEGDLPFEISPELGDVIPLFAHDFAQVFDGEILVRDPDLEISESRLKHGFDSLCCRHDWNAFRLELGARSSLVT